MEELVQQIKALNAEYKKKQAIHKRWIGCLPNRGLCGWEWRAIQEFSMEMQKPLTFTTARMGSCHCGDCRCYVYPDGTIRYVGKEDWQCSERKAFCEERRSYSSALTTEEYNYAMEEHGRNRAMYKKLLRAYREDLRAAHTMSQSDFFKRKSEVSKLLR